MYYNLHHSNFKPKLQKSFLILVVLAFYTSSLYSQYQSINDLQGKWSAPESWIGNASPEASVNGDDVTIYGEILSDECLEFNRSVLTIADTLVINGNLALKNTCSLVVESSGLLIVLGDYISNNSVDVTNNGTILIAGGFEMLGADNQGSFINNSKTFLFDPTPAIKNGSNYKSLSCTINGADTTCGYLTKVDYLSAPIRTYVESLPYDINLVSPEENSCNLNTLSISIDKLEICSDENIQISASTIGINEPDSLYWTFGANALPEYAYGIGPHTVGYKKAGNKLIELSYLVDSQVHIDTTVVVFQNPEPVNEIIGRSFDIDHPEFIETLCTGERSVLHVDGENDTTLEYLWSVPTLKLDERGINTLEIEWGNLTGVQSVFVKVISENNCHSIETEGRVKIEKCTEEDFFSKDTYAFTPNSDGYNDYWVIDGIEKYPLAKIRVYDKTGVLVFDSKGHYNNNWDGTHQGNILPIESYYYIIDLSAYQKEIIRGMVTILLD